jgi:hypothetical protein
LLVSYDPGSILEVDVTFNAAADVASLLPAAFSEFSWGGATFTCIDVANVTSTSARLGYRPDAEPDSQPTTLPYDAPPGGIVQANGRLFASSVVPIDEP